ncbi:MAG TPA: DNA polymerase I [Candidatus Saccharimonadales bacterium]|nr:DNA polymerase I [Candidatus Saccharimonadales bacterium]
MSKLVLVDGHALFHRAFHAMPPLTTSKGELVNAVFGFTSMLLRVLADIKPEYAVVAFDTKAPTFRHTQYTAYKAHRIAAPEEMHQQLPRVKEVVSALNIPIFVLEGYEADDIIGTLASQAAGQEVYIVTGDRDALQLVNSHIKTYMPGKSLSDIIVYDGKKFEEKYGFSPKQLIDFKALVGDSSDNIPGVEGIGEVSATKLIKEFGSVEEIYQNLDKIPEKLSKKLAEGSESAKMSKELATIDTAAPIRLDLNKCILADYDHQKAINLFEELEFKSLIKRLPNVGKLTQKQTAAEGQEELFTNEEQVEPVKQETTQLDKVLREMETHGVLIDKNYLSSLAKEIDSEIAKHEKAIYKAVGHEFNLNSPKQLSGVLFGELGLTPLKKGKDHASTDEETLTELVGSHDAIELLLKYRELFKLKSTYVDTLPLLLDKDNRIHTHYHSDATKTGRLSSKDPNLQNIPVKGEWGSKVREAFIAPKGAKLISSDYNQIELRVMAHLSQDKNLLEIFKRGEDIHTRTAAEILDKDPSAVTKDDRRIAKMVNFGIMYGISPFGLSRQLKIDRDSAKVIIDKYFEEFSGVKIWLDNTLTEAYAKGYVETLGGFRRYLIELKQGNYRVRAAGERQAINAPVQGTAADIIKASMIKLNNQLNKNHQTKMILQVHDELVFEVPDSEVESIQPVIKDLMEKTFKLSVPVTVEMKIGQNWGQMKPT